MSMGSSPMFPTTLYNYSISYLINAVNIATSHKKLLIKIVYTKKILTFLKLLKKINLIHNYIILKEGKNFFVKICPFYFKNLKIVKTFRLLSKPSRAYYISLKAIRLLKKRTGAAVYLISTSKGILTHTTALKKNLSGFLLGFFYI